MSKVTLLRNVRPYNGSGFDAATDLVIDGERIGDSAAPSDASVVDGAGGFLLPGLIDAHFHLGAPDTLEAFARHGVTTALDMGSWPASRIDSFRSRRGVTDIRSSGPVATSPASAHAARLQDRPETSLVAGPADAERFVAERKAEGVDYIKVVVDLPGFDQRTVDALVTAAHAEGYRVIIHASTHAAFQMARASGADVITHVPLDRAIDQATARELAATGVASVPTLAMMEAIVQNLARVRATGPSYEPARESAAALYAAGVRIFAGTDANTTPGVPANPPYGESLHLELELLVDVGLSTAEALNASTAEPAAYFGLDDRGRIEPGLRADLLLLDANPIADIRATRSIRQVWCAGTARL